MVDYPQIKILCQHICQHLKVYICQHTQNCPTLKQNGVIFGVELQQIEKFNREKQINKNCRIYSGIAYQNFGGLKKMIIRCDCGRTS